MRARQTDEQKSVFGETGNGSRRGKDMTRRFMDASASTLHLDAAPIWAAHLQDKKRMHLEKGFAG